MSLYGMFLLLAPQAAREVYQNANVFATVWQHDRRVSFWQPNIWEWSKYRCHEHARCGFTEHQCAVLILSHLAVDLSSSHVSPPEGTIHLIFHFNHEQEPLGFIWPSLVPRWSQRSHHPGFHYCDMLGIHYLRSSIIFCFVGYNHCWCTNAQLLDAWFCFIFYPQY